MPRFLEDQPPWQADDLAAGLSPFISDSGVVRQRINYTDDFVVGSPQITDDGNVAHDNRMFFDKSKGAFAAGRWNSTQADNIGNYSALFGYDGTASGDSSTHFGDDGTASGYFSTHFGYVGTASGQFSTHFGYAGTASGGSSTHFGGDGTASGAYSTHFGYAGLANKWAQTVFSAGRFAIAGDAQQSILAARKSVVHANNDATWYNLYLDGGSGSATTRLALQDDSTVTLNIEVSACGAGASPIAGYHILATAKNIGGAITITQQTVTEIYDEDASFNVQLADDDANEAVDIQVQYNNAAGKTIRWVAAIHMTETVFPD